MTEGAGGFEGEVMERREGNNTSNKKGRATIVRSVKISNACDLELDTM